MAKYFNDERKMPVHKPFRGPGDKAMLSWVIAATDKRGVGGRKVKGVELTKRQKRHLGRRAMALFQRPKRKPRHDNRKRCRANDNRKFGVHVHPVKPSFEA